MESNPICIRYFLEQGTHYPTMSILLLDNCMSVIHAPAEVLGSCTMSELEKEFCVSIVEMPWEILVTILSHPDKWESTETKVVEFLAKKLNLVCVEKVLSTGVSQRMFNKDHDIFEN